MDDAASRLVPVYFPGPISQPLLALRCRTRQVQAARSMLRLPRACYVNQRPVKLALPGPCSMKLATPVRASSVSKQRPNFSDS